MEKYEISLEKARKELENTSRMINVTFPVLNDNRFLIKIFEELHSSMLDAVRAILQYEYLYKRIRLYSEAESNFETFKECANRYNIPIENISQIKKIFMLMKKHRESPVEFVKKDKFVILSDNLKTESITKDILKNYFMLAQDILEKANSVFIRKD